jgi:hypothetical protein
MTGYILENVSLIPSRGTRFLFLFTALGYSERCSPLHYMRMKGKIKNEWCFNLHFLYTTQ